MFRRGGERGGGELGPQIGTGFASKDGKPQKTGGSKNSPPKTDRVITGVVTPKPPNTDKTLTEPNETFETISPEGDATTSRVPRRKLPFPKTGSHHPFPVELPNWVITLVGVGASAFRVAASAMGILAFSSDPMAAHMGPPTSAIQSKTISHMLLLANVVEVARLLGVRSKLSIVGGLDGTRQSVFSSRHARVPPECTKKHSLIGLRLLEDRIQILLIVTIAERKTTTRILDHPEHNK